MTLLNYSTLYHTGNEEDGPETRGWTSLDSPEVDESAFGETTYTGELALYDRTRQYADGLKKCYDKISERHLRGVVSQEVHQHFREFVRVNI